MVYFSPQQNNKNGAFLAGRKDGGECFHPLAKLHYRKRQKRKKKKSKLSSLTNQLYYHYTCYKLTAPIITSPPPGMETLQIANLCMCVFKFQTKLLSGLKLLWNPKKITRGLMLILIWYFWFHLLRLWMPKATGLNRACSLFLRDFNETDFSVTVGLPSWATE